MIAGWVDVLLIVLVGGPALFMVVRFLRSPTRVVVARQLAVFVVMFALFVIWAPWVSAIPREEALQRYPDLDIPVDWNVVVISHGTPNRWYPGTVTDNPIGFLCCLAAFIGCAVNLVSTTRQDAQPDRSPTPHGR